MQPQTYKIIQTYKHTNIAQKRKHIGNYITCHYMSSHHVLLVHERGGRKHFTADVSNSLILSITLHHWCSESFEKAKLVLSMKLVVIYQRERVTMHPSCHGVSLSSILTVARQVRLTHETFSHPIWEPHIAAMFTNDKGLARSYFDKFAFKIVSTWIVQMILDGISQ